jgi:hypothetical protein
LLDNYCSCGFQIEDLFDRSTTASDCCDANRGHFNDWAPTMDELDAFEREVDNRQCKGGIGLKAGGDFVYGVRGSTGMFPPFYSQVK